MQLRRLRRHYLARGRQASQHHRPRPQCRLRCRARLRPPTHLQRHRHHRTQLAEALARPAALCFSLQRRRERHGVARRQLLARASQPAPAPARALSARQQNKCAIWLWHARVQTPTQAPKPGLLRPRTHKTARHPCACSAHALHPACAAQRCGWGRVSARNFQQRARERRTPAQLAPSAAQPAPVRPAALFYGRPAQHRWLRSLEAQATRLAPAGSPQAASAGFVGPDPPARDVRSRPRRRTPAAASSAPPPSRAPAFAPRQRRDQRTTVRVGLLPQCPR